MSAVGWRGQSYAGDLGPESVYAARKRAIPRRSWEALLLQVKISRVHGLMKGGLGFSTGASVPVTALVDIAGGGFLRIVPVLSTSGALSSRVMEAKRVCLSRDSTEEVSAELS